jgi:hypothetical protein
MSPPKPQKQYYHQTFMLTLYRRHEGQFDERGTSQRRLDFGDGTGYIILEGKNVNVGDVNVSLVSDAEGWNIHMKAPNVKTEDAEPPTPKHIDKKPKS